MLVAVLGAMLVLSGLIASSSLVAHSALRGARTEDALDRLDAILRGGLELTAYQIFTLKLPPAAVDGRAIRFDTGAVTPHVTDEGGRIDVNASDPALLAGALRNVGLDAGTVSEITTRLAARRGQPAPPSDRVPHATEPAPAAPQTPSSPKSAEPGVAGSPDGAAATGQGTFSPPDAIATQRNTGFRSVAEFFAFAGLDRAEATALSAVLTVSNPEGRLNVLAASRAALLALPGISPVAVEAIMTERRSALRSGLANLKSLLDAQKNDVKFESGPCYRVRLAAMDALGRVASREAVIAAGDGPSDPFFILDWE